MLLKWFISLSLFVCLDRGTGVTAAFLKPSIFPSGTEDAEIEPAHKKKTKKQSSHPEPVHVHCRCPPGFSHHHHSCVKKDYAGSPKAVCDEGKLDKGQCVVKESEELDCPGGTEFDCDNKAPAKQRCCRQTERVPPGVVCPEGSEETKEDTCKRLSRSSPHYHCPPGYTHHDAGFCIRIEEGSVVPVCGHGGELTEDNYCLASIAGEIVHECPEGYECAASRGGGFKQFCTSCVKEKEEQMDCTCPAGTKSLRGMCFHPKEALLCFKQLKKKKVSGETDDEKGDEMQKTGHVEQEDESDEEEAQVEVDMKKFGKKCGAISPTCICRKGSTMRCTEKRCECITEETAPVKRRCLDTEDSDGHCVKEVRVPPVYQCGEGQECELVSKKSECRCVKKFTAEHTTHCGEGVLVGAECFSIEYLQKVTFCPPEFELVCEGENCECQRQSFVARVTTCPAGSYITSKGCKRSYPPELVCTKGTLEKGKCYHKNYAVQVCDA